MASKKVTEPKVKVKVVSSFYDLKSNNILRTVGDVIEVTEKRADYLISRKLVIKGE